MKKLTFIIIVTFSIFFLFCIHGCANKQSSKNTDKFSGKLIIMGSSSMQEVCDSLAKKFMEKYPNINVTKSGVGSGEAANAVRRNICQIGDISRPLQNEEHPNEFSQHIIATDGIAICTNKKNKLKNISKENLQKIFSGKIKNWAELGGNQGKIALIGRDYSSGNRTSFEQIANVKNICDYSAIFDSNGKVKFKIQKDENAIGYISFNAVDSSVNALSIDGATPTYENILNFSYPFHHPLIQITKKETSDEIVNIWFDFVFSPSGKKIIEANNLLAASKNH